MTTTSSLLLAICYPHGSRVCGGWDLTYSSSSGHEYRLREVVKGTSHALGEHLHIRAGVLVGDGGEVELAGVGQHRDGEGQVALDRRHREQLQQPRAGKVQRHWGTRDVGDRQAHRPRV